MAALVVDRGGTIRWASVQIAGLLGLPAQAVVGLSLASLGTPFDDERIWDGAADRLRPQEEVWESHLVRNIGHGEAPLAVALAPLDGEGRHLVTFRPAHQLAPPLPDGFVEIQRLASLGRLTGAYAHDFNNVLVGVLGGVALLQEHLDRDDEGLEIVEILEVAARRAQALTKQILGYANASHERRAEIDLNQLISETLKPLRPLSRPRCKIMMKLEEDLPLIRVEPVAIQQVVINLVLNALESMPEQGEIHLTTHLMAKPPKAVLRTKFESPFVAVSVRDTGQGIHGEDVEAVFDPRHSAHGAGRGLGLAASQAIARRYGGEITVRSEAGRGSAFTLWLPTERRAAPRPEGEPEIEAIVAHPGECVMLVDDEEIVRAMGSRMLKRLGYEVITAVDGRDAQDLLRRRGGTIDLAIIDMVMPELDGRDTLRALREIQPDLRAVLTSGFFETLSDETLREEGFMAFIGKPYRLHSLGRTLREALDR
jgi:signal transduction histidine kinase/CheY-like chemotaxis protein